MSTSDGSSPWKVSLREIDPLLKDLSEKKQSFRHNVVLLAGELKDVRSRLASREQSCAKETLIRQGAEARAKDMEEEILTLQKRLHERNEQLQASAFAAEKFKEGLDNIKLQLAVSQATADASAKSAQTVQSQCSSLLRKIDEKNTSLKEHDDRITRLGEQLENLQKDLQTRESSEKQLRDEVLRLERDILQAVSMDGANKNPKLRKLLDEVSPRNFERINKLLMGKDDEVARLRDEMRIISAHWRFKTKDLEDQLENQRRVDQELKKKVLRSEFCLREARAQTRKLQKMEERRDVAIKDLRDKLAAKQQSEAVPSENQNFWDKSGFKIVVSMSMLILVVFSRR